MQKNGNHNNWYLRPQRNQIRTQDLEARSKLHNYMETEEADPDWLMDK